MQATAPALDTPRYARCVEVSKRIRWEIEQDLLRGRVFDFTKKFLPDRLSKVDELEALSLTEKRLISQIQGRTYANMLGLVQRFIGAKVLDVSRDHWLGDQTAFEALVRFTDEALKHQELFRRLERMIGKHMPEGYVFLPARDPVASVVLGKSTWAVLALICHIEVFVLAHYQASIEPDEQVSELYKDVFLFHAREGSQHTILDELEWSREDAKLTDAERDRAVDDLIELVGAIDRVLAAQANADTEYFLHVNPRILNADEVLKVRDGVLRAYRYQYVVSGVSEPRFANALATKIAPAQGARIRAALAPILNPASIHTLI